MELACRFLVEQFRQMVPDSSSHRPAGPAIGRPEDMCGWPPARKDFLALVHRQSLAVMCRPVWRGSKPQARMGSVDRGLIRLARSRCPMSSDRFPSIRRSTGPRARPGDAITRLHPRKSSGGQVQFLCSTWGRGNQTCRHLITIPGHGPIPRFREGRLWPARWPR